jgi:DNA-binding winged helix-turn-helix (wHTH) protein
MSRRKRTLYRFGPFRLDCERRLLLRASSVIPLTTKAFETLLALVESRGKLMSKSALMNRIWPDTFVEEGNLTVNVFAIRKALGETPDAHRYILTVPGQGYRFVGSTGRPRNGGRRRNRPTDAAVPLRQSRTMAENSPSAPLARAPGSKPPLDSARLTLEPAGGALALDSSFYIERAVDDELHCAIARHDSIVLIKGARQVGKTSLLARGLERAREAGTRVAVTDCQSLEGAVLSSAETFYRFLAESIREQLGLPRAADRSWSPLLGPGLNFERFLARDVLKEDSPAIVWALDEVDRLLGREFAADVFALLRSWHNKRALDPGGRWRRLTLVVAYATEAHLFIPDLNQSPFNVGTRLALEDFSLDQVGELNRRYGSPLRDEHELARYRTLVGGHPYLAHRGLYEMATRRIGIASLEAEADREEGSFGDHLHRLLVALRHDAGLVETIRSINQGRGCPEVDSFYRLRAAGVLSGDIAAEARLRCGLYARYLAKQLP